jgi:hypothetical protein
MPVHLVHVTAHPTTYSSQDPRFRQLASTMNPNPTPTSPPSTSISECARADDDEDGSEGAGAASSSPFFCCIFPTWRRRRRGRGNVEWESDADESEARRWNETAKLPPPAKRGVDSCGRPLREDGGEGRRSYLTVREVEARMMRDGFCWYIIRRSPDCEEKRILYYLYGREFGGTLPRGERRLRIRQFIANAGAIDRMNRVLACVVGEADSTQNPTSANRYLWRKMQDKILCYGEFYEGAGVHTIFGENNLFPFIMVLQKSKNCFINAPITQVNYMVTLNSIHETGKPAVADFSESEAKGIATVEPVDASRYIRHRFSNDDLEGRVVGNEGGSSKSVLQDLLGDGDNRDFEEYKIPAKDRGRREAVSRIVVEALKKYGPALLPCFNMTSILALRRRHPEPSGSTLVYMPSFDVVQDEADALTYNAVGACEGDDAATRATKIAFFEEVNGTSEASTLLSPASSGNTEHDEPRPPAIASPSSSNSQVQSEGDDAEEAAVVPAAYHAMVVIGSRFDGIKHWFLIQNSWRTMPLLEMSDEFLAKYQGEPLVFVTRNVSAVSLRTVLSSRSCVFYECSLGDDGGDKKLEAYEEGDGANLSVKRACCN